MAEALSQVKKEFGSDAVILNTRSLPKRLGSGRQLVELTAARQKQDLPVELRTGTIPMRSGREDQSQADGAATVMTGAGQSRMSGESSSLAAELSSLKSLVGELVQHHRRDGMSDAPKALFDAHQQLITNDVAEQLASELIEDLKRSLPKKSQEDPRAIRRHLASSIAKMIPSVLPGELSSLTGQRVIALVGPTGVGKTTTIAKIAANYRLRQHKRVGLITIDTYRIAAVQQLQTYAQIIDVPIEVAATPMQFRGALSRLKDCDIILIDTAGRSQRDKAKNDELQVFFDIQKPDEIHLVLSTTSSPQVLKQSIERFRSTGFDRLILTKLDEAVGFGVILACLIKAKTKLSYLTMGQEVPDDITVGEGNLVARMILNGSDTPVSVMGIQSKVTPSGTSSLVSHSRVG